MPLLVWTPLGWSHTPFPQTSAELFSNFPSELMYIVTKKANILFPLPLNLIRLPPRVWVWYVFFNLQ